MILTYFKNPKIVLFFTLLIIIPVVVYNLLANQVNQKVLSTKTSSTLTQNLESASQPPPPLISEELTTSPAPSHSKSNYTIVLYGDSMVETMGDNLPYLETSLRNRYTKINFKLYNYGIGGENVTQGLARFNQPLSRPNRNFPPVSETKPDIIILGSFSYNPFSPHDKNKHWLALTELVKLFKTTGAKIYLLAEIAPLKLEFGKGEGGINWPQDLTIAQAAHIVEQLEGTVGLAIELEIPIINAFEKSRVFGQYGQRELVSFHDGIHPSDIGHQFTADLIAQTLILP